MAGSTQKVRGSRLMRAWKRLTQGKGRARQARVCVGTGGPRVSGRFADGDTFQDRAGWLGLAAS